MSEPRHLPLGTAHDRARQVKRCASRRVAGHDEAIELRQRLLDRLRLLLEPGDPGGVDCPEAVRELLLRGRLRHCVVEVALDDQDELGGGRVRCHGTRQPERRVRLVQRPDRLRAGIVFGDPPFTQDPSVSIVALAREVGRGGHAEIIVPVGRISASPG